MKKCPNCHSEVDDNFDVCWNCQYSFSDQKIIGNSDIKLICPKCGMETEATFSYCPHCHYDLREINKELGVKPHSPKKIDCLRCNVPMEYQGNFKFHEGTRVGALGNLFELFTNRESFDLFSCPNCGKVEFFLPGFD
jgi:Zn finger protein HypA/HybF involved in hydrogenase expression